MSRALPTRAPMQLSRARQGRALAPMPPGARMKRMTSTADLTARAREIRDASFGARITVSPKVFIPLTRLGRDRCGYCTFATAPRSLTAPYLPPEDVLQVARAGAEAGCHEALFTLGEKPELRYPQARAW